MRYLILMADSEKTENSGQESQGTTDQSNTTSTTNTTDSSKFQLTESEFKRGADTKDVEKR